MLFANGALAIALTLFWVYTVLEVITTDESRMRNLPKLIWVFLVVLLLDIGALAWWVAGRPKVASRALPDKGNAGVPPEYDRPCRATATNPDDDAAFLAQLRERAEEQRKKAAEQARLQRQQEDGAPAHLPLTPSPPSSREGILRCCLRP
ncbi:MAG: PLDc N-terminal domain-containing protein [Mycobacteriales bacterium]